MYAVQSSPYYPLDHQTSNLRKLFLQVIINICNKNSFLHVIHVQFFLSFSPPTLGNYSYKKNNNWHICEVINICCKCFFYVIHIQLFHSLVWNLEIILIRRTQIGTNVKLLILWAIFFYVIHVQFSILKSSKLRQLFLQEEQNCHLQYDVCEVINIFSKPFFTLNHVQFLYPLVLQP